MGKILVAGKHLNLEVRGLGEKPSWGETRSSATGGSHPGQESWSVSGGEAHIPQSLGTKGNQEGWPSWEEYRSGGTGGPHPGVDIFPDLSPRAKLYCGVKCSQGLHFPATDCWLIFMAGRGRGLCIWKGWGCLSSSLGCKFQILVLLRVFWEEILKNYIFSICFIHSIHVIKD